MNTLVITWSMIAAACAMLGLIQAFLWWHSRRDPVHLLSMIMAFSAVAVTILEMIAASSPDIAKHEWQLLWGNLAIAMVLVPMVWSVQLYLPPARRWLAALITALWTFGIAVNFLLPGNLTFSELLAVEPQLTRWGDEYFIVRGTINSWKWVADITVFLIPLYAVDAAWRARKLRRASHGWIIAGGVVLFVLVAGVQAILIDTGIYRAPHVISLAFLFVVFSLTWVLARDAVRTGILRKKVEQAQKETEGLMRSNLMGEVAAALAHELNQPLAAILGNAQAAEKFLDHPEPDLDEIREIVSDIVRDDKRARDIINNIRNMLKGDSPEDQHVNIESATRQILDFMGSELERYGTQVRIVTKGDIPRVCGGQVAIQQVIMNLLMNAEQAMRNADTKKREIRIRLSECKGGAEITVRDSGPGISDEVLEKIFDPFVSTKSGNLGMGLTVCRRIIENQGGRMTAENTRHGGARFRIWLPACKL